MSYSAVEQELKITGRAVKLAVVPEAQLIYPPV